MSSQETPRRTPLYSTHVKCGAKIIDFHGWDMPIYYSGIRDEHHAVRNNAGIFDVCHMGYVSVCGPGALKSVQKVFSADASAMSDGMVLYGLLCNEKGGIVDDVTVFKIVEDNYFFCVNASNVEKDYEWIKEHTDNNRADVKNESDNKGIIALQGPASNDILEKISSDVDVKSIGFFRFATGKIGNDEMIFSRTGYTGEKGFELFIDRSRAESIWDSIMDAGRNFGLKPAGLGARDTLRLEMKYTLYGNDIDETVTPFEACLDRYVSLEKGDFVGRDALINQKNKGIPRKLVGFKMIDAGIAREGYDVAAEERVIGKVTSGNRSLSTNASIGMALVETPFSEIGKSFYICVRGKNLKAEVVKTPFYIKNK